MGKVKRFYINVKIVLFLTSLILTLLNSCRPEKSDSPIQYSVNSSKMVYLGLANKIKLYGELDDIRLINKNSNEEYELRDGSAIVTPKRHSEIVLHIFEGESLVDSISLIVKKVDDFEFDFDPPLGRLQWNFGGIKVSSEICSRMNQDLIVDSFFFTFKHANGETLEFVNHGDRIEERILKDVFAKAQKDDLVMVKTVYFSMNGSSIVKNTRLVYNFQ